jgi:hypothetical protein
MLPVNAGPLRWIARQQQTWSWRSETWLLRQRRVGGASGRHADRVRTTLQQAFADSAVVAGGLGGAGVGDTPALRRCRHPLDHRASGMRQPDLLCGDWLNGSRSKALG